MPASIRPAAISVSLADGLIQFPFYIKVDISLSVSVLHTDIVSQAIVQDGNVRSYRTRVLRPGIGIQGRGYPRSFR
jgi:hypothetical protein